MKAKRIACYRYVPQQHLSSARELLGNFSNRHCRETNLPRFKNEVVLGLDRFARDGIIFGTSSGVLSSRIAGNLLGKGSVQRLLPPEALLITEGDLVIAGLTFHLLNISVNDRGNARAEVLVEAMKIKNGVPSFTNNLCKKELFPELVTCLGMALRRDRTFGSITLDLQFKTIPAETIGLLALSFSKDRVTVEQDRLVISDIPRPKLRILSA